MATQHNNRVRVGEVRPSQIMYTYGIGSIVDLPKMSVIVTGLEDWRPALSAGLMRPITEDRLLAAVRFKLPSVRRLLSPPVTPDESLPGDPVESTARLGVPVATFPRWMVCPQCRMLAPLSSGLFKLKGNQYHPDRTVYYHENCNKGNKPEALPVRFIAACESGHLDDFPWVDFVHRGEPCEGYSLRLYEFGPSGEARDLEVRCVKCDASRRMAEAFGQDERQDMPLCRGRRPQLRDYDPEGCKHRLRPMTLGQSNTWFSVVLSTLAIPVESDRLAQLVDDDWARLQAVITVGEVGLLRRIGQLGRGLALFPDEAIMQAIEQRRTRDSRLGAAATAMPDLKEPEWRIFTHLDPALNTDDFRLRRVGPPTRYASLIEDVVLVERLREVSAMIGFTRIDALGELNDPDLSLDAQPAPISRQPSDWVPANEIRGEGIFIRFNEARLNQWLQEAPVRWRDSEFFDAHKTWRRVRRIQPPEAGYPGMRYVLLHSFAHALMRQIALECGYTAASVRERIYSRPEGAPGGPMAGILIYTSAPDSEGTLGGLVSMGEPDILEQHISRALESTRLCASDPICAEHEPGHTGQTLHGAACHACLFVPETSCERGNKYLDRSVLVETVENILHFFR